MIITKMPLEKIMKFIFKKSTIWKKYKIVKNILLEKIMTFFLQKILPRKKFKEHYKDNTQKSNKIHITKKYVFYYFFECFIYYVLYYLKEQ